MSYETVLLIHIGSFVWNIGLVVCADSIGLLWAWGKLKQLPEKFIIFVHRGVWIGLGVSIVTGTYMFWGLRDYLLSTPPFYTKMAFLLALLVNSFFIARHLSTSFKAGSFSQLDRKTKRSFFISGAVSAISWLGVFISAMFLNV